LGAWWHDAHRAHVAAAVVEAVRALPAKEQAALIDAQITHRSMVGGDGYPTMVRQDIYKEGEWRAPLTEHQIIWPKGWSPTATPQEPE
jgi:hypothetical protein